MSYREIDVNPTKEQIARRDTVRRFGAEVVRPAGMKLDKLHDPADVTADGVNEALSLTAMKWL